VDERLIGVPVQDALDLLRRSRVPISELKLTVSPMAHLVLIKVLLSEIYTLATPLYFQTDGHKEKQQMIFDSQFTLHNWLGTWLAGPDTPPANPEPLFYHNALPFYWLAQISLMAYQENLPPFQQGSISNTDPDARYRLVNWWQKCARNFLRSSDNGARTDSTVVWDEMMRIRLEGWKFELEGGHGRGDSTDFLDFFANVGGDR
jgi:hypothetical protein